MKWLIFCSIIAAGCDSNLEGNTVAFAAEPEADLPASTSAPMLSADVCLDPNLNDVPESLSLTLCNGELVQGLLAIHPEQIKVGVTIAGTVGSLIPSPAECFGNGLTGCVTTDTYKSADLTNLAANNIKSGITLAGVSGTFAGFSSACTTDGEMGCIVMGPAFKAADMSLIDAGKIKNAETILGVNGNYGPGCTTDGGSSCLVDGTSYKAAKLSNFTAADLKTGVTVAGVSGSAMTESHAPCALDGDTGCIATASYKAADMSQVVAGNLKNGITVAGVVGTYPSASTPLVGATAATDLLSLGAATAAGSYEFFDSTGLRHTGAIADAGSIVPGASDQIFDASLYRQFTVTGDSDLSVSNIRGGVDLFGVVGTLALAPATCSANAEVGCVTTVTFKAADLSNLTAANIKKNVVLAGVTGDYPSATNPLAGSDGTADLPAFASTSGGATYEWFSSDGTRLTDATQANESVTPGTANQTLNAGLYRSVTVAGDADLVAGNIKDAVSIFGVTGNVVPSAAICSSDGEVGCVTTGSYKAANMTNVIPSNIKDTIVIAGVTGNLSGSPANCSSNGQQGCVTTLTYRAADLSNLLSSNIKTGVTIAGTAGTYPSLATPLAGATGTSDLISMASTAAAGSYEFFDSTGTRYTGSIRHSGVQVPSATPFSLSNRYSLR